MYSTGTRAEGLADRVPVRMRLEKRKLCRMTLYSKRTGRAPLAPLRHEDAFLAFLSFFAALFSACAVTVFLMCS